MTPRHRHFCTGCDCAMECRREDCQQVGWTCPVCEDEQQSDYFATVGDQPRLPMDEPAPVPMENF